MTRVSLYIDGFNLYHGMKADSRIHAFRWLDLRSLGESLLAPGEELEQVVYFTALAYWDPGKRRRHETYIRALESVRVEAVLGHYQPVAQVCLASCGEVFDAHVEKKTDVNIATRVLVDSAHDRFDWAYLLTADSDQVPTIRAVRELAPTKKICIIAPPKRNSDDLRKVADRYRQLGWKSFRDHLLPSEVQTADGFKIRCPREWLPPSPDRTDAQDGGA